MIWQTFVAEYSDSRDGQCAMRSLDGHTMYGNRIRVMYRYQDGSSPVTAHNHSSSEDTMRGISRLVIESPKSLGHVAAGVQTFAGEKHDEHENEIEQIEDMTNSSPFTHRRPLPPCPSSLFHTSSAILASPLHHTTSEQDLRRRAASVAVPGDANAVSGKDAALARRTSITFGQDAHRHAQACANATAFIKSGQIRARSISDSSASPPPAQVAVKQSFNSSAYVTANAPDASRQAKLAASPQGPREIHHNSSNYGTTSSLGLSLPQTPQNSSVTATVLNQTFITPPGIYNRQDHGDPQTPNMYYPSQVYWPNHSSPLSPMMPISAGDFVSQSPHNHGVQFPGNEEYAFYTNRSIAPGMNPSLGIIADGTLPRSHSSSMMSPRSPTSPANLRRRGPSSPGGRSASDNNAEKGGNGLDIERIAQGLDTRTTVMVKNIPNKLSDRELIEYIANVEPNRIDFLYLRMDFQNGTLLLFILDIFPQSIN